ncbi:MAG: MFS family permease, partial [Dinoroseobacter sp.]
MTMLPFLRENARWLAAGALLSFLSSFGQTFFIALFAGELRDEFALSLGQWGGIYAVGTATSAAIMVFSGTLADKIRIRTLGLVIISGLALSCFAMAFNPSGAALVLVILALRFTGQGMLT